jgi:uncharacterized protein (DUF1501 family)
MFLDRREFLGRAVALGGVLALPRLALADDAPRTAARRTLVLLHLAGGNDGLNTVIPVRDPAYARLRPSLAVGAQQARPLAGDLALHPSLEGLQGLFERGRLAVVNGVGYPDPNYSHFRATEIWYTAQPEQTPTYGWIGRAMEAQPRQAPLRAVALQKEPPLSLVSAVPGAVTLTDFGRFRVPTGMEATASLYERYAELEGARAAAGEAGAQALEVAARIARLKPVGNGLPGRLGESFRMVLALLQEDLGLECIQLQQGGYDTHSNQAAAHPRLLAELGNALAAFQREAERLGLAERCVVVVFSEFGRRAEENISGGTDHGSAGPVFVVGTGLNGGLHGEPPSLEDLDAGNLRFTTDFRRLYAALLRRALDLDPAPVLGDYAPLEVFA